MLFGFDSKFCIRVEIVLHLAKLSLSVNGKAVGFFSCRREVRKGDPLSPLLFCVAEEVLTRGFNKLVSDGKLLLMSGARGMQLPSHVLYADDVMVFCKATQQNLAHLKILFNRYFEISGQMINSSKSTFYLGAASRRQTLIVDVLVFSVGKLPCNYLGVPIFKGKPRRAHLMPIADKIKSKLSAWKAYLLSITGRVQLVRSVI